MSRAKQIEFLSRSARLYDPVVTLMGFRRLWRAMAKVSAPKLRESALDVCTGTGGVAFELARMGADVIGVDLAAGMLSQARRKHAATATKARRKSTQASRPSVTFLRMDARHLAFADRSFSLVTCTMALHEMAEEERQQVLGEITRVARDRVIVAEYGVPDTTAGSILFRIRHGYEYLESDDFERFVRRDVADRLEQAGLQVEAPHTVGNFRIWPCRVNGRMP